MKNNIYSFFGLVLEMTRPTRKTFIFVLIILIGILGFILFQKSILNLSFLSDQEDGVEIVSQKPTGFIYFGASDPDVDFLALHTYVYNLQTEEIGRLPMDSNYYEFSPVDDSRALFVTTGSFTADDTNERDLLFPALYDFETNEYLSLDTAPGYSERDLAPSPDGMFVAFSNQESISPEIDNANIKNWQIVITELSNNTNTIIKNAVAPQWIRGSEELLFIREDGIYSYNVTSSIEKKVFGEYVNYTAYSEMAVAPSKEFIVVTSPSWESSVLLLKVEKGVDIQLTTISRSTDLDMISTSPVVSPDGQHYAILVSDKKNQDREAFVQVKSIADNQLILNIPTQIFSPDYFKLNFWSDTYIPTAFSSDVTN